jgi:hypothetical protein
LSQGAKSVIVALLGERYAPLVHPDEPAVQGGLSPATLQCAARVLLPELLYSPAPAAPAQAVSAAAWVSFCVEILSLALAQQAPLSFPAEPGSQPFLAVSERLLQPSKSRLRLTPDSRRHR